MIGALKKGAQQWGELMWNRGLAAVICRETSVLEQLYPVVKSARRLLGAHELDVDGLAGRQRLAVLGHERVGVDAQHRGQHVRVLV